MEQHFIALDFGSGQISASLSVYDTATGTFRVRHALRETCPSVNGCYILDFDKSVQAVGRIFSQLQEYADFSPIICVGLRGDFLSFSRSGAGKFFDAGRVVITQKDVQEVVNMSVSENASETLEVIHLFPQTFNIDGCNQVQNPVGLEASSLDIGTFITYALRTHLNNLNRVLSAAGCEDFEATPTIIALSSTLLKPEEKKAGVLLVDVGANNCSAALYHKGILHAAWEFSFGAEIVVQEVADVLQNDLSEAKQILKDYIYGEDEIMDDLLDEAGAKFLQTLRKQLLQEPLYANHFPATAVFTGGGAGFHLKNTAQRVLGVRRSRLATFEHLIADGEEMLTPAYTSALAVSIYSQQHGGKKLKSVKDKANGLLGRMLAKLGMN